MKKASKTAGRLLLFITLFAAIQINSQKIQKDKNQKDAKKAIKNGKDQNAFTSSPGKIDWFNIVVPQLYTTHSKRLKYNLALLFVINY